MRIVGNLWGTQDLGFTEASPQWLCWCHLALKLKCAILAVFIFKHDFRVSWVWCWCVWAGDECGGVLIVVLVCMGWGWVLMCLECGVGVYMLGMSAGGVCVVGVYGLWMSEEVSECGVGVYGLGMSAEVFECGVGEYGLGMSADVSWVWCQCV